MRIKRKGLIFLILLFFSALLFVGCERGSQEMASPEREEEIVAVEEKAAEAETPPAQEKPTLSFLQPLLTDDEEKKAVDTDEDSTLPLPQELQLTEEEPIIDEPGADTAAEPAKEEGPVLEAPEAVITEERPEVIGFIDFAYIYNHHPLQRQMQELADQINSYYQAWDERQDEFELREEEINSFYRDVEEQVEAAMAEIYQAYKEEIDAYQADLQKQLDAHEEAARRKVRAAVEEHNRELSRAAEELIQAQLAEHEALFNQYKKDVEDEYARDIFNLRLQLQVTYMSEEERIEKETELRQLEAELEELLLLKEEELQAELNELVLAQEQRVEQEVQDYLERQQREMGAAMEEYLVQLEDELKAFIERKEEEMQKEMAVKQQTMFAEAEEELRQREKNLEQEMEAYWRELNNKINEAHEQIAELEERIYLEIKAAVARIAAAQDIDVVLTEVRVNIRGVDLTHAVIDAL